MFEEYYNEPDPVKRKNILDGITQEEMDEDERKQINKLFESRYTMDKKCGYADNFLGTILDLQVIAANRNGPLIKKQNEKQVHTALNVLCLDQPTEFSQEVLYREMCHLVKAYISICQKDKSYNAIIWGMGKISNDVQTMRIIKDLDKIVEVVTRYPDIAEKYIIFQKAIEEVKASLFLNYKELESQESPHSKE